MKIKIGTRKSKLALWQAEHVKSLLEQAHIEAELIPIETKGDKILNVSISKIGSKGVFTEELEAMLIEEEIDIAVHSAKDLQSILPESFEIIAFSEREKENDVLVTRNKDLKLTDRNSAFRVGTSSTRRVAALAYHFPNIVPVEIRGNLQTRIKKMDDGLCEALLLARAGVVRMNYHEMINQTLPLDLFTPPVGQGSLAIESCVNLEPAKKEAIRKLVNHSETEMIIKCERAYLRKLKGGCSIPAFGNAQVNGKEMILTAGLFSLDGSKLLKRSNALPIQQHEQLGEMLGTNILEDGGAEVLASINKELNK